MLRRDDKDLREQMRVRKERRRRAVKERERERYQSREGSFELQ